MKKTMLIVAACFLFVVNSVSAEIRSVDKCSFVNSTLVEMKEINVFCKAIVKGDIDLVKKLIALGEDVNQKSLGMTPAIFAARYNKADILRLLIKKGADLSIRSNQGHSIVKYAEAANAKEALLVLNNELGS